MTVNRAAIESLADALSTFSEKIEDILDDIDTDEADTTEPVAFKKGDSVRITGLSYYGADARGKYGTVTNPVFTSFTVSGSERLVEVRCGAYTYLFLPSNIVPEAAPKVPSPAEKRLDIASMYDDRRIAIEPWGFGTTGVQITLKETRNGTQGTQVFAFMKPEQIRQIIAALEANLA